jgi:hypothetical protein
VLELGYGAGLPGVVTAHKGAELVRPHFTSFLAFFDDTSCLSQATGNRWF